METISVGQNVRIHVTIVLPYQIPKDALYAHPDQTESSMLWQRLVLVHQGISKLELGGVVHLKLFLWCKRIELYFRLIINTVLMQSKPLLQQFIHWIHPLQYLSLRIDSIEPSLM